MKPVDTDWLFLGACVSVVTAFACFMAESNGLVLVGCVLLGVACAFVVALFKRWLD